MEHKIKIVDICWEDTESKKEVNNLPKELELTYTDELLEEYGDLDTLAGEMLNDVFNGYAAYDYCVL